ncbi:MAG: hypothetical protein LBC61_07270 [Candidatus Peribacteria bacterium]|nr:hypothetical protein [Candidatus Peribacteria bacterium]
MFCSRGIQLNLTFTLAVQISFCMSSFIAFNSTFFIFHFQDSWLITNLESIYKYISVAPSSIALCIQ